MPKSLIANNASTCIFRTVAADGAVIDDVIPLLPLRAEKVTAAGGTVFLYVYDQIKSNLIIALNDDPDNAGNSVFGSTNALTAYNTISPLVGSASGGGGGGSGVTVPPVVIAQGGIAISSPIWFAGSNRIIRLDLRNANPVPIFIQYHNKLAASLVDGDIPVSGDIKVAVAAAATNRSYVYVDNTVIPRNYGANTLVALSLTENTYTAPSAAQLLLINFNLETII